MSADEWVTEEWTYCGQRMSAKGYLMHDFLKPDGERGYYKAARGEHYIINGMYRVDSNGESAKLKGATYIGPAGHDDGSKWVAEDRAAKVEKEIATAEKSAKKEESKGLGEMTLQDARSFINSGPWTTRAARVAVVLKTLGI